MKWLYAVMMFLLPVFCVIGIYRYNTGMIAGVEVSFLPEWPVLLQRFMQIPEAATNDLRQAVEGLRQVGQQFTDYTTNSAPITDWNSFWAAIGNGFAAVGTFFSLVGESIGLVVTTLTTPIRFVGFAIDLIFTM